MNKKKQEQKPVKQIPKKKLFWFRLAGVMMPFLFLLLLELVLRLFHYGYSTDLFIEYPGNKDYLVMSPDASRKYFSDQAIATTGNTEPFKKEKDDNTLRIFVLGESTTIGYPYFHNASFHRWLQYRIGRGLPDKNLEIINCALTAVNSYTVLGFAKQVVNYQPDAVLIYVGHNEYYGALGVGSTDRLGGNSLMIGILLRLRQLRIAQLVANTWQGLIRLFRTKQSFSGKTRMELMVGEQKIPYESTLFNRGVEQFRMNMDATLSYLNRYHIPVYVSNLVSNEKDLKPFVSAMPDTLKVPQFAGTFRAGEAAWQSARYDTALEYLSRAGQLYSGHARCNYYLGWLTNHAGDSVAASRYFSKALDLDELRFRAPHQLNEIIAALCRKYPNTHLVDTRSEFERWSAHHIIGDELILEHVHPNLMGYALMADAFYQALKQGGLITIPQGEELSFEACLREMPVTAVDSLTGAIRINRLKNSWPFSEVQRPATDSVVARTEESKLAEEIIDRELGWSQAMEELYAYSIDQHDLSKAKRVVEALTLEYPQEEAYLERAANLCGQLKQEQLAAYYFRRAFSLNPSAEKARYLFVLYLKMDEPDEAIPYLDYAINNGGASRLIPVRDLARQIAGLKAAYAKDSANLSILNEIAEKYAKMGDRETAEAYLNNILQKDKANQAAIGLLNQIRNAPSDRKSQ